MWRADRGGRCRRVRGRPGPGCRAGRRRSRSESLSQLSYEGRSAGRGSVSASRSRTVRTSRPGAWKIAVCSSAFSSVRGGQLEPSELGLLQFGPAAGGGGGVPSPGVWKRMASSARSLSVAATARSIAMWASAARPEARVGRPDSRTATMSSTLFSMASYRWVTACASSEPVPVWTRSACSWRRTASRTPATSGSGCRSTASPKARRSASSVIRWACDRPRRVSGPALEPGLDRGDPLAGDGARDLAGRERHLDRGVEVAQGPRLLPLGHGGERGEGQQDGDRQQDEQHQLGADTQPRQERDACPRSRRRGGPAPRRGAGRGLVRGTVGGARPGLTVRSGGSARGPPDPCRRHAPPRPGRAARPLPA